MDKICSFDDAHNTPGHGSSNILVGEEGFWRPMWLAIAVSETSFSRQSLNARIFSCEKFLSAFGFILTRHLVKEVQT
jgi:hypothetical protein